MVVKRREMKGHSLEGRTEAKIQADEIHRSPKTLYSVAGWKLQ
jgi:hypothetical protein